MRGKHKDSGNKYIVLLLLAGAVYFFLRYLSPLLTPVILAGMFLTLCYPAFDDIQKKTRIKKQYLASGILILVCVVLIILVWLGGSLLIQKLPAWVEGLDGLHRSTQSFVQDCCDGVGKFLRMDTSGMSEFFIGQIDIFIENFEVQFLPAVIGNSWHYIRQLFAIIAVLAVTMIATVLFAKDYDRILSFMGAHEETRMVLEIFLKVIRYIATFLKAQLVIMLLVATICGVLLSLFGVEHAVFFGILAGIMDALPFIGTGIVLTPLGIWQLVQGHYWRAVSCMAAYVLCILLREMLEPRLIGKKEGLYPIAVLAAIYGGIKLFGIWGIVKGPVGVVMFTQAYAAYCRYVDGRGKMNYDKKENTPKEGAT